MAATDNSLARSNKSGKEDKATKKRPAQLSLKPGSPARALAPGREMGCPQDWPQLNWNEAEVYES
jgi:hypothetical protein